MVGVSQYVADYFRRYAGIDAVHVPISLMEPGEWPALGSFDNEFVTLVNPCAVKGISIFLALAAAFPETAFAAVPTWGATRDDRAALDQHANVRVLEPVDDIDLLLKRTKVLLVPSLWAEARSRIVVEAMLRGVPVLASNVGGIPEAKMGVPYLLPVAPITKYQPRLDEEMVPIAEVPHQDVGPWQEALGRLLTDAAHYREISRQSRAAALEYAGNLSVEPFERLLEETVVGRTPWSAADAPVGFAGIQRDLDSRADGGSGGTRADQGVRPTRTQPVDTLRPDKRRLPGPAAAQESPTFRLGSPARIPSRDIACSGFHMPGVGLHWLNKSGGRQMLPYARSACLDGEARLRRGASSNGWSLLVEALAGAIQPYLDRNLSLSSDTAWVRP